MSESIEKKTVGFEQPIALKKIYFGVVCAFCGLIGLMIFNLDNYKTWFSLPMLLAIVAYYYFFTLNVSNVYKYGESIIVEHAIKGEFVFDKNELTDVKSTMFLNKIHFKDMSFYTFHSAGFIKSLLLAGEKNYEQDIKRILLS